MARRTTPPQAPPAPPHLVTSRQEAAEKIKERIDKGGELRRRDIASDEQLSQAWKDETRWSNYNKDLLTRLFDNPSLANEYDRPTFSIASDDLFDRISDFHREVDQKLNQLESILERLDLIPEISGNVVVSTPKAIASTVNNDIFIVHGHDEAAKHTVARFIEKLDLQPIILHEKPNAGRTLIEKFEHHSAVSFAIVLLTPDDVGHPKGREDEKSPRARQNVIFELGYFLGKLTRARVCALHQGDVEILSDYLGVVYIPMDTSGAWQLQLAKEMKQAGLDVDLNKAL
jgi:predicted nucleotide-binding protein